jgi:hypothetical protein
MTFLEMSQSERKSRRKELNQIVHVVTIAERSQAGFAIVGIYSDRHDAQLKVAEIRGRIARGERKPVIIGVEEYPIE